MISLSKYGNFGLAFCPARYELKTAYPQILKAYSAASETTNEPYHDIFEAI